MVSKYELQIRQFKQIQRFQNTSETASNLIVLPYFFPSRISGATYPKKKKEKRKKEKWERKV